MKYKVLLKNQYGIMRELNEFAIKETAKLFAKNYKKYALPHMLEQGYEVKIIKEED